MNTNAPTPPLTKRVELLAPAGSLSCALAAFDAGADAVYAGLKSFNARERTENFSHEDMSKLLSWTHRQGKRVYITLNTLIRETELDSLAEEVAAVVPFRPDAFIVQDLGVLTLIRRYFPQIPVHASTQMGFHNSAGLQVASELGFSRVILERQTTLQEIRDMMRKQPPVELEMFIHGALCCCISGSCLLSSWLGGWSGNRGKCKQPCRRRHHSANGNGFFLSAQDLCMLERIPELVESGVSSFKIEGRLRRPDYVATVVQAYRMALDAVENHGDFSAVLPRAKALLAKSCGRKWSFGFYTAESARTLIKHDSLGASGLLCGTVVKTVSNGFHLEATRRIHLGDVLRLQPRSGDEGPAVSVTRISLGGVPVTRIQQGQTALIHSDKPIPVGSLCYKTGESVPDYSKRIHAMALCKPVLDLGITVRRHEICVDVNRGSASWREPLSLAFADSRPLREETIREAFRVPPTLAFDSGDCSVSVEPGLFFPASVLKTVRNAFFSWLAEHVFSDGLTREAHAGLARFRADYAVLPDRAGFPKCPDCRIVPRTKRLPNEPDSVIAREPDSEPSPHEELLLPFFIPEPELAKVRASLETYLKKGGSVIRISSLHQLGLIPRSAHVTIKTNQPLPVCNSFAADCLRELGVSVAQAWLELGRQDLIDLIRHASLPMEVYRYGRPPLLSTRAKIPAKDFISDLRGKKFHIHEHGGLTQLTSNEVMSIPKVPGANAYCMDYRYANPNEAETGDFNFECGLS